MNIKYYLVTFKNGKRAVVKVEGVEDTANDLKSVCLISED